MANWFFYDEQGNKYGPNDVAQIRALVQRRVIVPTTRMEDSIGRQGLARQIPGLFPNNPRQVSGQYNGEKKQKYNKGGHGLPLSLGLGGAASVLTFVSAMFGINAFQKAAFYAKYQDRAGDSLIDVAWRYHNNFNGWALTGSIIGAIVVFGVAFLITWLIAKNKS